MIESAKERVSATMAIIVIGVKSVVKTISSLNVSDVVNFQAT